ncbi:hypothetical protein GCM10007938_42500 [Vibrio zhanjiangensis]|uniref:RNA-binding protein n=1 Tax=Vibrio zhanjiangensis TaxID=1046128 RepID=A0ABQ6F782_9VIBR|nr:hypothetical protein [Vibrio zhanjiangensis]GLT20465.1 hypothetical protein GCM10007938_42500 [Vibrio zhanjiangensis]
MLTIVIAKTSCVEPRQLIGQHLDEGTQIKSIKTYGKIDGVSLFAALVDSPNTLKTPISHVNFEGFAVHPVHLRPSTRPPRVQHGETVQLRSSPKWRRRLKRYKKNEIKTQLSESSWSKFVKKKHVLSAYQQINH